MARYDREVIQLAAEITKAAVSGDKGGAEAVNNPAKVATLLTTVTVTIDRLLKSEPKE